MFSKKIILALSLSLLFFGSALAVRATDLNDAFRVDSGDVYSQNDRLDSAANNAGFYIAGNGAARTPEQIVSTVITAILSLMGVIFIIIVIYGGILWMIAGGNEEQVSKAKRFIKEAIIGLVIVVGAYALSFLILSAFMNNGKLGSAPAVIEGGEPTQGE